MASFRRRRKTGLCVEKEPHNCWGPRTCKSKSFRRILIWRDRISEEVSAQIPLLPQTSLCLARPPSARCKARTGLGQIRDSDPGTSIFFTEGRPERHPHVPSRPSPPQGPCFAVHAPISALAPRRPLQASPSLSMFLGACRQRPVPRRRRRLLRQSPGSQSWPRARQNAKGARRRFFKQAERGLRSRLRVVEVKVRRYRPCNGGGI